MWCLVLLLVLLPINEPWLFLWIAIGLFNLFIIISISVLCKPISCVKIICYPWNQFLYEGQQQKILNFIRDNWTFKIFSKDLLFISIRHSIKLSKTYLILIMNTLRSMSIKKYGLFECFIFLSRNLHQTLIPVQENQCLFLAFQIYCFIVSGIKGSEKTKFPSIRYGFIIHISHSKTEKL